MWGCAPLILCFLSAMVAQLGEKYEVGGRKCFFLFILLIDAVDLLLVVVVVGCWG